MTDGILIEPPPNAPVPPPKSSSSLPTLLAVCFLVGMAVVGIVLITVLRPGDNNTDVIGFILATTLPTLTAVLAYLKATDNQRAVQDVHLSLNSRLSQLLALTSAASHAEGKAEGLTGIPTTPPSMSVSEVIGPARASPPPSHPVEPTPPLVEPPPPPPPPK